MPRHGDHVRVDGRDVLRPGGLGRVQQQRHALGMAGPCDFLRGLNLAGDVAGMAENHQRCFRRNGSAYRFRRQNAPAVRRQNAHGDFARVVIAHQRPHHRVMLGVAHQHLVARS